MVDFLCATRIHTLSVSWFHDPDTDPTGSTTGSGSTTLQSPIELALLNVHLATTLTYFLLFSVNLISPPFSILYFSSPILLFLTFATFILFVKVCYLKAMKRWGGGVPNLIPP